MVETRMLFIQWYHFNRINFFHESKKHKGNGLFLSQMNQL